MLYKVFLIAAVTVCSYYLGMLGEKRIKGRMAQLKSISHALGIFSRAITEQSMTAPDALIYCGQREWQTFAECGRILKKYPRLGVECVLEQGLENTKEELEPEDKKLVKEFLDCVFFAVSSSDIESACTRYPLELAERMKDISEVRLKKAKLKKTMFIMGGIAVSIILV